MHLMADCGIERPLCRSLVERVSTSLENAVAKIVISLDLGSWLRGIVAGGLVHFIRSHLAGDIAHLLTDVVPACTRSKSLELCFDVDG
jgi:hypothetical protein